LIIKLGSIITNNTHNGTSNILKEVNKILLSFSGVCTFPFYLDIGSRAIKIVNLLPQPHTSDVGLGPLLISNAKLSRHLPKTEVFTG